MAKTARTDPGPLTRAEADENYRLVRTALLGSVPMNWVVGGVVVWLSHWSFWVLLVIAIPASICSAVALSGIRRSIYGRVKDQTSLSIGL